MLTANAVFCVCAACMWAYMRLNPPGIAFTYCWLWYTLLAVLSESKDALAVAFCMGFGLNLSWYTTQLVDSLLWSNLLPYWHEYLPQWCTESLIRVGDIMLHPLPLFLLLPYHREVNIDTGLRAFLLERWYFILVEGQPLGTGSTTNIIYDFRPHLPRRTFLLSQYLTNLGYFLCSVSQVGSPWARLPLQLTIGGIFVWLCIIHTDRWNFRKSKLKAAARVRSPRDTLTPPLGDYRSPAPLPARPSSLPELPPLPVISYSPPFSPQRRYTDSTATSAALRLAGPLDSLSSSQPLDSAVTRRRSEAAFKASGGRPRGSVTDRGESPLSRTQRSLKAASSLESETPGHASVVESVSAAISAWLADVAPPPAMGPEPETVEEYALQVNEYSAYLHRLLTAQVDLFIKKAELMASLGLTASQTREPSQMAPVEAMLRDKTGKETSEPGKISEQEGGDDGSKEEEEMITLEQTDSNNNIVCNDF